MQVGKLMINHRGLGVPMRTPFWDNQMCIYDTGVFYRVFFIPQIWFPQEKKGVPPPPSLMSSSYTTNSCNFGQFRASTCRGSIIS